MQPFVSPTRRSYVRALLLSALGLVAAAACGGVSGGATTQGPVKLGLVAYSTPQQPYEKIFAAFEKTAAGANVTFAPAAVFWNAVKIFSYGSCGVEYATSDSLTCGADGAPPDAPPQAATATTPNAPSTSVRTYERRVGLTNGCTGSPSRVSG